MINHNNSTLFFKQLGIDSYKESIIYLHELCQICLVEGLEAKSCVQVSLKGKSIIATVTIVKSDLIGVDEVSLSEYAQKLLDAQNGDEIVVNKARPVSSLSFVRSKIYGNELSAKEIEEVIRDIVLGLYSDVQISAFLTACSGGHLNQDEILNLTKAMIKVSKKIHWDNDLVVDKHCIGGIPGNRTTPIIVSIVAAFGLMMPKTSSRSITSSAGTADTMEVLAPVRLDIEKIKEIVSKESGCIVWGDLVSLSPADDILVRIERALNLDSEGQMVASILSKKIAAGSTHILIEIPIGKTSKVRSWEAANILKNHLEKIGKDLGVKVKALLTDGSQPIGNGIGPALEARDIILVLQNKINAPQDLRDHALNLAGEILEFSAKVKKGDGIKLATKILNDGDAWQKFKAICEAQGGMRKIPEANYIHQYLSQKNGVILEIDNRRIAMVAKIAGAPLDKTAGVDLFIKVGAKIKRNDVLFAIHSNSTEELTYALGYIGNNLDIIKIKEE